MFNVFKSAKWIIIKSNSATPGYELRGNLSRLMSLQQLKINKNMNNMCTKEFNARIKKEPDWLILHGSRALLQIFCGFTLTCMSNTSFVFHCYQDTIRTNVKRIYFFLKVG